MIIWKRGLKLLKDIKGKVILWNEIGKYEMENETIKESKLLHLHENWISIEDDNDEWERYPYN